MRREAITRFLGGDEIFKLGEQIVVRGLGGQGRGRSGEISREAFAEVQVEPDVSQVSWKYGSRYGEK